ncbi:SusC/RagA family TonB-linked outer membrane protein [Bacteroides sp.]|uniref:SusC/RagA family TonB-linked outer membrane protein n=1 Tax=Bacteroides sp. TaxID=29523 RepID=UPI0025BE94BB|nr:TonB-dependent receptor [Bacteroides sp.]
MNKKNYIKKTTLPVALFFSFALIPIFSNQGQVHAAVDIVQQQGVIKGTVVDEKGEPIIGANVIAEGSSNGTITDIDGNFRLNVKPGTKLKISYIGYTDQVVAAKDKMKIVLTEDATALEEVEIVAYGVQKKVSVTGAISSVKAEDVMRTPVGSISNILGGQMSGLTTVQYSGEPGADAADIFVRGKATWTDSSPLIQIDGVAREASDMAQLDPNEIESISILKDASATAVFGIRGANGVVLITTKRGREGKAKISFTTSASVLMPTKMVEQANSYEYATFYNQMLANDGSALKFSDEVIQKFKDHSDPIRFPDVNWVDYVMKDATLQSQHNLNISGGTDRVRYFISAGAYTQGGMFKEYDLPYNLSYQYRRFNYRTNLDIDVTKTTKLSINISGNLDNSDKPNNSGGTSAIVRNIYYTTPFHSPGIVDGKMVYATDDEQADGLRLPFTGTNDAMTYRNGKSTHASNNKLSMDLALEQKLDFITKGLNFKLKGAYNSAFSVNKTGECGIASYTPILKSDGTIGYKKSGENSDVKYGYSTSKARDWYMEAGFNYSRSFNNHNVGALLLYNQSKEYYYGSSSSIYRDIPRGYVGLVGRVTYDWKSRYLAEFNIGYNGSENFAPESRFGVFPAGSFGWVMSEEKWFNAMKPWVSFLKLRASFGLVGNDKTSNKDNRFLYVPDPYNTNMNSEAGSGGNTNFGYIFGVENKTISLGSSEASKNNPNVGWEKSFKQNYGIDINFFDNKLGATAEYYREHRTNILLQNGQAPGILGFAMPWANLGIVDSWGWELSLKWNDKAGKNFRYWATVNLSYNQNEIIENMPAPQLYDYQYLKGHRIGARKQYVFWRYYDEGTPELYEQTFHRPYPDQKIAMQNGDAVFMDLNGDRIIDNNDMSYDYGYTDDPEYMIGINLGFVYKNWEVSTQWTGAWNVTRMVSDVFRRPFRSSSENEYGGLLSYHLNNTWTEENPSQSAKYPRASFLTEKGEHNYADATLYEQDSKYLRLKTLQVAYNFKFPFMKKLGMSTMQLAFSGYNLWTLTPYLWGDPEARASSSPAYPLSKTYTLSLKLGF